MRLRVWAAVAGVNSNYIEIARRLKIIDIAPMAG